MELIPEDRPLDDKIYLNEIPNNSIIIAKSGNIKLVLMKYSDGRGYYWGNPNATIPADLKETEFVDLGNCFLYKRQAILNLVKAKYSHPNVTFQVI